MNLDPSQRPAEATPRVSTSEFVSKLRESEVVESEGPEAEENRARAGAEITMIFELKDSRAFQWFEVEFIDKPYRASFDALRDEHTKPEDLGRIQTTYAALKKVKIGILEREIAHREQLDPTDPEVLRLRERVALM